jgi:hypothetical protein
MKNTYEKMLYTVSDDDHSEKDILTNIHKIIFYARNSFFLQP